MSLEESQSINQKKISPNKTKNNLNKLDIILIAITILFIVFVFPEQIRNKIQIRKTKSFSIISPTPAPSITSVSTSIFPSISGVGVINKPTSAPRLRNILKRDDQNKKQDIFNFDRSGDIIRWRNLILYTYNYGEDNMLSIYLHNINSGETKPIFQMESEQLIMSDLNIIGDTLYFGMGDFLRDGKSYWIDLNTEDKSAYKLADKSGSIMKIKGRDFFVHGTGDACWGKTSYALINLDTRKITPIVDTVSGCTPGDEAITITEKEIILATHGDPEKDIPGNIYTSLYSLLLTDSTPKKQLISTDQMPKNVTYVEYLEEQNNIILLGESIYVFSLDNYLFDKIIDLPNNLIKHDYFNPYWDNPQITSWDKNIVCIEKDDNDSLKKNRLLINLDTKTSSQDFSNCPPQKKKDDYKEKTPQEIFRDLDLPANYRLVQN